MNAFDRSLVMRRTPRFGWGRYRGGGESRSPFDSAPATSLPATGLDDETLGRCHERHPHVRPVLHVGRNTRLSNFAHCTQNRVINQPNCQGGKSFWAHGDCAAEPIYAIVFICRTSRRTAKRASGYVAPAKAADPRHAYRQH
jgi:hypothetical protein